MRKRHLTMAQQAKALERQDTDGDLDIDFLDYDWSLNDGGGR